ncbi:MAG: hypothetical protein U0793_05515 [Gemmataceae bacterium]
MHALAAIAVLALGADENWWDGSKTKGPYPIFVSRRGANVFFSGGANQSGDFWKASVDKLFRATGCKKYSLLAGSSGLGRDKLSFSTNCLWMKSGLQMHRIPFDELELYKGDVPGAIGLIQARHQALAKGDWGFQYWHLPTDCLRTVWLGTFPMQIARTDHRYDAIPLSDGRIRVLLAEEEETISVWDVKGKLKKNDEWDLESDKAPREIIRPGVKEGFYAIIRGDDYYLLTYPGRLFHAAKPRAGADPQRKLSPLAMPKGELKSVTVFTDMDKDKVFLLATTAKGDAIHFAELKRDIRFETFPVKDLAAGEEKEPVRSVRHSLQVLRERKLIAGK